MPLYAGRASGIGNIASPCGGLGRFNFMVRRQTTGGPAYGQLLYGDRSADVTIRSTSITSFVISGNTADFSGTCGNGCTFTVHVVDGGASPSSDSFSITSGSYSASGPLVNGNILVRR